MLKKENGQQFVYQFILFIFYQFRGLVCHCTCAIYTLTFDWIIRLNLIKLYFISLPDTFILSKYFIYKNYWLCPNMCRNKATTHLISKSKTLLTIWFLINYFPQPVSISRMEWTDDAEESTNLRYGGAGRESPECISCDRVYRERGQVLHQLTYCHCIWVDREDGSLLDKQSGPVWVTTYSATPLWHSHHQSLEGNHSTRTDEILEIPSNIRTLSSQILHNVHPLNISHHTNAILDISDGKWSGTTTSCLHSWL